ncbi:hypothetical protein CRENBAI_012737 [Crenichthys baileyi]|uniref:Uncharacterized protein n=1 Tax=Crenichthys baileyi TaxID=28760 RepID=A0AAV9S006_9TELE
MNRTDYYILLDHFFAEYWTICTLLDTTRPSIGHFVSQDSPLLQIPADTAADMTGRPSSDVTTNYITDYETANHCFSHWKPDQHLKHIPLEKKSHVDFHSFSFVGQRKRNNHERSFWNKKARNFTLLIEDVSLTSNRRKNPHRGFEEMDCHPCFCFSRLLMVRSYFPLSPKEARGRRLTALPGV